ncbi:suppressor of fused domain protein [Actinoplanes sp. NPDC051861]|uniref:suppressor of fused domain protein n=1 Tax=Actinoplanes sp. NPDC051861 TaxID=3155170 RepID=UPI0034355895
MTSTAPGRDAIDAALARRYPGVRPHHQPMAPATAGGLHGCSAYRTTTHWHFVTYGLSELGGKSPDDDPDFSGWGFELTLRIPAEEPMPTWPIDVLRRAAQHVNSRGVLLEPGHRVDLGDTGTLTVAADPDLGVIDTPNGQVQFLLIEQ